MLTGARITSEHVKARVREAGIDSTFVPVGMTLPLGIASIDPVRLRRAIGNAAARVDSARESSGSSTRRTTLDVTLTGPPLTLVDVELQLAGRTGSGEPPLQLLSDIVAIDAAIAAWLAAPEAGRDLSRPAYDGRHPKL